MGQKRQARTAGERAEMSNRGRTLGDLQDKGEYRKQLQLEMKRRARKGKQERLKAGEEKEKVERTEGSSRTK